METFIGDMIVELLAGSGCTKDWVATHSMRIPLHKLKYSHNPVDIGQIKRRQSEILVVDRVLMIYRVICRCSHLRYSINKILH